MYEVIYTGQFKKSLKLCVRRGLDIKNFTTVLDCEAAEPSGNFAPANL